jgi:hypothetical protein
MNALIRKSQVEYVTDSPIWNRESKRLPLFDWAEVFYESDKDINAQASILNFRAIVSSMLVSSFLKQPNKISLQKSEIIYIYSRAMLDMEKLNYPQRSPGFYIDEADLIGNDFQWSCQKVER